MRASGWLFIAAMAVFVALLATSSAPSGNAALTGNQDPTSLSIGERLMAGEQVRVTPHSVQGTPMPAYGASTGVDYTVSAADGYETVGLFGGPGPAPLDAPFGTEVQVTTNTNAQSHPSVAVGPDGNTLLVAYTNQTGPTNRDLYVARSTNGGATWTHIPIATAGGYNEFDPRVITFSNRVIIFYANDDPAGIDGFRRAVSADNGMTWTIIPFNFTNPPFRDFRSPDAHAVGNQWMYAVYELFCDTAAACNGWTGQAPITILFDTNAQIVNPSIYHPFGFDMIQPSIAVGPVWTLLIADADATGFGGALGDRDVLWGRSPTGRQFEPPNIVLWQDYFFSGLFATDSVRVDGTAYGTNHMFPYQVISPANLINEHIVVVLFNNMDADPTQWILGLIAGAPGVETKNPSVFSSTPLAHATFWVQNDLYYSYSLDAANTWSAPTKVNSNTGTVIDAMRSSDVIYAGKVRVAFQDNRLGNDNIMYTQFSGWSFYIFDRQPSQGTIDILFTPTAVPTAQLFMQGAIVDVAAPPLDPLGPGARLVFNRWSDGDTNPTRQLTVGAPDVTLIAIYSTEYFLDISTTVPGATTNPTSQWYPAGTGLTITCTLPPPAANERFSNPRWDGLGPGSFTGDASVPQGIAMNGPISEVCSAVREFQSTFDTNPGGLQISIDGQAPLFAPQNVWWVEGTDHTVECLPQISGNQRRVFTQWDDGNGQNPRTFANVAAPIMRTCLYSLEYLVTITPTPADCDFSVDTTNYGSAQTFWFPSGEQHTVDTVTPQMFGVDRRYVFVSWDDGGAKNHVITITGPLNLALLCEEQWRYLFDSVPSGRVFFVDGPNPQNAPLTLWWATGSNHNVELQSPVLITADERRVFLQWQDADMNNPRFFSSIAGPGNLVATTALEYRWVFTTNPAGLTIVVDGQSCPTAPTACEVWWRQGTPHTVQFNTVTQPDTQLVFERWSDGNTQNPRTFPSVAGPGNLVIEAIAQYRFIFDTSPPGFDLTVDSVTCGTPCTVWWEHGTPHTVSFATIQAGVDSRRVFDVWSDTNPDNPRSFPSVQGPAQLTLQTILEYRYLLDTTPTGLALTVDGTPCTAQCTVWWRLGSNHNVLVPTPQGTGDTRQAFTQWSDLSTQNPRSFNNIAAPGTLTAQTVAEYRIQLAVTGASGIAIQITVDGTAYDTPGEVWLRAGSSTFVTDSPIAGGADTRYRFDRWSDGNTQGTRVETIAGPRTFTAVYVAQYLLTVDAGTTSVTASCSNADCWYDEDTSATASLNADRYSPLTGTRLLFTSWGGDATGTSYTASGAILMDGPKSVSVNWQAQVLITVQTTPSGLSITITSQGQTITDGYVNAGQDYTVSVPEEATIGGKTYRFVKWTGGTSAVTLSGTANAPTTLTAEYREVGLFESPAVLGGIIAAIIAAVLLAVFLLMRRRKKEPVGAAAPATAGAGPEAPAAPSGPTMECPSCGLTIEAKTGPCPICGAEVVAPAMPEADDRLQRLAQAYQSGRISKEQYEANVRRLRNT